MSVFSELVNESGTDPTALSDKIYDEIMADPPARWNLASFDELELWGALTLRQMFSMLSRGESPTTYTRAMADRVRAMTEKTTLLGFDEEPVETDYTRALRVVEQLRSMANAVEGEVVDVRT